MGRARSVGGDIVDRRSTKRAHAVHADATDHQRGDKCQPGGRPRSRAGRAPAAQQAKPCRCQRDEHQQRAEPQGEKRDLPAAQEAELVACGDGDEQEPHGGRPGADAAQPRAFRVGGHERALLQRTVRTVTLAQLAQATQPLAVMPLQ